MYFEQFYLSCLAHASYMIGSAGVAAVVDPQRDVELYIDEARKNGLRIAHVIETQQPYLGRNSADIRRAFFDHALIASLGCASVINIPVRYDGRTVGVVNLLHQENWYRDERIPLLDVLCALLVPAFLEQP